MEKSILVSDTHLGLYKSADVWHDVTYKLFQEIVDVATKRDIKTIYHLGDFFDNRRHINIKSLYTAYKIAELLTKFNVYIIIGNHDTFYRDVITPTSLSVFEEHQNITIVDKITTIGDLTMVPWNTPIEDIPDSRYLMGHFEIQGFPVVQGMDFYRSDVVVSQFSRFEKVYSGHFHIPSHRNNITYLGAPFQSNFGDVGSSRGYYVFEDGELEFIKFSGAPEFVVHYTDEPLIPSKIRGNIVKLVYRKDYGSRENNRYLEEIQLYQPLQLFTDFGRLSASTVVQDGSEEEVVQLKSNRVILEEYLKKIEIPSHLQMGTLKGVINNLLKEEIQ